MSDDQQLRTAALEYHRVPTPGKISITPTKGLTNQLDLSLAYSPGVAYACTAIVEDPREARKAFLVLFDSGNSALERFRLRGP